ncbi:hypothetical protein Q3G72_019189 [Acer saccharum]|nr:hypothetical protein Q3G72_019189 [Acer saccharum]
MDSEKEAPTYGPWLIGRNGNGNSGFVSGNGNAGHGNSSRNSGNGNSGSGISGKTGSGNLARNGSGNSGNGVIGSGNAGSSGKFSGNGNISSRRPDDVGKGTGMGKPDQLKSGVNGKVSKVVKTPRTGKNTGLRFDILNEEGDVIMREGSSQVSNKTEEGRKIKSKVFLSEVTNQRNLQGRKSNKISSQNSKLLANKGPKKFNPVIQAEVACEGDSTVNTFSCLSIPTSSEPVLDDFDSATILRHLHNEVTNFETHLSDKKGTFTQLIQNNTSTNMVSMENFESVASELEEAMVAISE